ncbi:MAG: LysR family transcriptional regulator [Woeseiaceae bacterium]|nr:LysR family transcriptional regulator [Woeseiaceae bacterium]
MHSIGIRQARVFLAVADALSVTGAASALNRSQTSVTKSLHDLEHQLGVELFDRSSKGVSLTAFGECLLPRAREAADAFARAGELVPPAAMQESSSTARFFRMDVSDKWLDAFLATYEHQSVAAAAEHLQLTPAAISSSLRKLEDTLHTVLFERTPTAIIPSAFGKALANYVKLARSHLRHACDELAGLRGVNTGQLTVGTLPFVRTIIVPRAINSMLEEHPYLDVSTIEGPYDDLVAGLRCGDIDIMVGALRGAAADKDLREEEILVDSLSAVVRAGHPLLDQQSLQWQDLLRFQWILPRRGTPTRTLFEAAIVDRGLDVPPHVIETSSLVMLRGLLLESDRVTVLSRHQVRFEEQTGLLAALSFELSGMDRPIGLTCRKNGSLSPAATQFAEKVRAAAAEFRDHHQ